jgi:hypothetical protein
MLAAPNFRGNDDQGRIRPESRAQVDPFRRAGTRERPGGAEAPGKLLAMLRDWVARGTTPPDRLDHDVVDADAGARGQDARGGVAGSGVNPCTPERIKHRSHACVQCSY